jgi:hypothetical protein
VGRMGAAVVGMELAALIVAVLAFGWPVLLVGVPLFVGTLVALVLVRLWELVRSRVERQRATRWDQAAAVPEGLMSGFFAVSAVPEQPPLPRVDVPVLRTARGWAEEATRSWASRRRAASSRPADRAPGSRPRPVRRVLALSDRLRPPR